MIKIFAKRPNLFITGVALGCLASCFSGSAQASNLVVNGTFDNNSTGWTGSYSTQTGPAGDFPILNTQPYFWAGNVSQTTISQTYDLTSTDLMNLSSSGLDYVMSADLFGFATQNDHSIFRAVFFDNVGGTGNELSSISFSSLDNDPGTWPDTFTAGELPNFQSLNGSLNINTKSIVFELEAIRTDGTSNDGYADNLSFTISPRVVPEPSTMVGLLAITSLGLGLKRKH